MPSRKTTFAVFFGNRGFFPASLQASARREMTETLKKLGHHPLTLDVKATRFGAVETRQEGERFARFLREQRGNFGGIILCLPNFGDENGAIAALKDAGTPILIQAYPDELNRLAPAFRRDAFCGKMSITDIFVQHGVPFTALPPHTVHPTDPLFAEQIDYFDRLCRVHQGLRAMVVGAIGARTTAFKTVRIDELALQQHGITMETVDLSEVLQRMRGIKPRDKKVAAKARILAGYACWEDAPRAAFDNLVRLGVVLDELVAEYRLDAMAVRCWTEMQNQLGISPCVLLSEMNNRGIPVACEVDVGNAIVMRALALASGGPATCLDWNNNYGAEPDKCILFHCGPVPQAMMTARGRIADHAILANAVGRGRAFGCNTGRITNAPFTFGSLLSRDGRLACYVGQGRFTADPIPADYFGCAGVAEIDGLQDKLLTIGSQGHRHHVSVTFGHRAAPVCEAFEKYLHYQVTRL